MVPASVEDIATPIAALVRGAVTDYRFTSISSGLSPRDMRQYLSFMGNGIKLALSENFFFHSKNEISTDFPVYFGYEHSLFCSYTTIVLPL